MRKLSNGEQSPFQSFRLYLDTRLLDRLEVALSGSNHQGTLSYLINDLLEAHVIEREAEK